MYNRDCMIHHCTNFIRSGSPYEEVIKPVLESYFGEGCTDAPKHYTPINEAKIRLAKWAFIGKQWHDSCDAVQLDVPHDPVPVQEARLQGRP